jgi:hypothetical protein
MSSPSFGTGDLDKRVQSAIKSKNGNTLSSHQQNSILTPVKDMSIEGDDDIDNWYSNPSLAKKEKNGVAKNKIRGKPIIPMGKRSICQQLSRELIERQLGSGVFGGIDNWDPLVSLLSMEEKNKLVKDLELQEVFVPTPGVLAPALKGKGQLVWNRDNALLGVMTDINSMMQGTSSLMALILEGRSQEAVSLLAKMVVLESDILSRLNAERHRIHFNRDFADKVLKSPTEPIVREEYKLRAKEAVQLVKDSNVLSNNFFHRGGKGIRERKGKFRFTKRMSKPAWPSFPRLRFNKFNKFNRNQKFQHQNPKSTGGVGQK